MTQPRPEPDAAEVRRLETELAETRKRRVAMQREAAESPSLRTATERVERDRSALTTSEIDDLREHVQRLYEDLAAAWDGTDRNRQMLSVLSAQFRTDYRPLEEALAREAQSRFEAADAAAAAGVPLTVPLPMPSGDGGP
jgi:hypothetical protein